MRSFSLKLTEKDAGVGDAIAHLKRLGQAGNAILKKRFAEIPGNVVPQAKAGAPVDNEDGGQLRDSIRGSRVSVRGGTVSVSVTAGGESLVPYLGRRRANVYAIVQETDYSLKHDNGHAGFLGKPWYSNVGRTMAAVRADLDKEVANVGG